MCCSKAECAKYLLLLANFIFILGGLSLFSLGVIMVLSIISIMQLIHFYITLIIFFTIVIGAMVIIVSLWGCFGAIKKSRKMLATYLLSMLALAPVTFGTAVLMFINQKYVNWWVVSVLDSAFLSPTLSGPFLIMEIMFGCCGTTGPDAYYDNNLTLPASCCYDFVDFMCFPWVEFNGCNDQLSNYLQEFEIIVRYVISGVAIIQLVAIVMSFFLIYFTTRKKRSTKPS